MINTCARYPFTHTWIHDDVIKWKHFPRYWPFVRGIHWSQVNSPHKAQWRWVLMFSLIYTWINNRDASDLRRHRAHHDVTVVNVESVLQSDWIELLRFQRWIDQMGLVVLSFCECRHNKDWWMTGWPSLVLMGFMTSRLVARIYWTLWIICDLNACRGECCFRKLRDMIAIALSIMSQCWDKAGSWHPSLWRRVIYFSCLVNAMVVADNIPVSPRGRFRMGNDILYNLHWLIIGPRILGSW